MSSRKNIVWPLTCVAFLLCVGRTAQADARWRGRYPVRQVVVVSGFYADPFWYEPWNGPQWGPYPYPSYRFANADSAVKLDVKPKEAEVYVDGYYAGIVDDFDGVFQRLRVPPGEHDIELYLDGYRTVHQKVYLTPDNTFKIKCRMERLAAGETPEPRPQPMSPPMPPMPLQPPPGAPGNAQPPEYATLAIRVQPSGADILIDGEVWHGPAGQDRLVIDVTQGQHTVEIRKAGYRTYVTGVEARRGETTSLNVSLKTQ